MTRFFESPSYACATPMLMVLVVLQVLVAVLLSAGYRGQNNAVRSQAGKPGAGRRAGMTFIQIICALLVIGSLWIVLLGPALLQVLAKSGT